MPSWLRVNRAALPQMRLEGDGLIVYVGSVTSSIYDCSDGGRHAGAALPQNRLLDADVRAVHTVRFMADSVDGTDGTSTFLQEGQ